VATITSKHIIDEIIADNGKYEDDPLVVKIVEYSNMFNGELAWGIIYAHEDLNRYHESSACINPKTIWEHDSLAGDHGNGSW
jgi:hypothetical protein